MKILLAIIAGLAMHAAHAKTQNDYLVKFAPQQVMTAAEINLKKVLPAGSSISTFGLEDWRRVEIPLASAQSFSVNALSKVPGVIYVQPNYKVRLLEQPSLQATRARIAEMIAQHKATAKDDCPVPIPGFCDGDGGGGGGGGFPGLPGMPGGSQEDNPAIPPAPGGTSGDDPLFSSQWGMNDIGAKNAWNKSRGDKKIVVAVIDTGVDYTHEDLVENIWRNPGETGTDSQGKDKSTNGVDDDKNGFVDDTIGWDFVSNDNKPYDLAVSPFELIFGGGNPGHGTHCAGNVAARGMNGKGISGVAPNVSIMAIRFLSEKGEGTTAGAVQSIKYALANGANITSNSWGSEGEDSKESEDNKALREAVAMSQAKGVLFIAAAGNGHQGVGYNNDTDAKPGYPASYPDDIIVSVAAVDSSDKLGSFSNWGKVSVDIGAPGVKVFSTTVGSTYADSIGIGDFALGTWDGTSMATPHVAGAAALYLSAHPNATWSDVKNALLKSAKPISALNGKTVSGGKLNVEALMNY